MGPMLCGDACFYLAYCKAQGCLFWRCDEGLRDGHA